jgi:hypothetical protein
MKAPGSQGASELMAFCRKYEPPSYLICFNFMTARIQFDYSHFNQNNSITRSHTELELCLQK